ncbi:Y55_G0012220.mRNA.1.CDS.1 [Saccharomyces cerevisiae]|nr:Y55_G0012220.mRNA.1.CDS.1 [Saccharomyces cerevisiae]
MMIIIFIELCRIADSLLWIPKSSRRTSSISTYLILSPYKKWNPNNYLKIHILSILKRVIANYI